MASTHTRTGPNGDTPTKTRLLQRQILPVDRDTDVIRLYVDPEPAVLDADKYEVGSNRGAKELNNLAMRQAVGSASPDPPRPDRVAHRAAHQHGREAVVRHLLQRVPRQLLAPVDHRVRRRAHRPRDRAAAPSSPSTGRWPTAARSGSTPRPSRAARASSPSTLPLTPFVDGGWYWYDVIAGRRGRGRRVRRVDRRGPRRPADHGSVTIGITTMNRPDFCAKLLSQLGDDHAAPGRTSTRCS